MEKKYSTYIFDLYGTLIDIHTDEQQELLWEELASEYRKKGVIYTAAEIQKDYLKFVHEEEEELGKKTSYKYPEIMLEKVFARLYNEGIKANSITANKEMEATDPWIWDIAVLFRTTSRSVFKLFTNTLSTLNGLRERGAKIYLLSNAQRCFTEPEMKELKLWELFDGIFISSDHQKKKPQPEFMQELLAEYGIAKDTAVMVGNDFTSDIRIALSCGLESIFLNTDSCSDEKLQEMLTSEVKNVQNPQKVTIVKSGDIAEIL